MNGINRLRTALGIIWNSAYWKLCRIRHSFHAAEHLSDAFDAAYGADDPKATAQFEKYRHRLRHEVDGVVRVIRALRHLRSQHPGNERIAQALGYFRNNQHRMGYAQAKARRLPVGSGVVEATCKTLVTERLKRSGMRWSVRGGQAILTVRAWLQSNRFEAGWAVLSDTYRSEVSPPQECRASAPPHKNPLTYDQFRGHTPCTMGSQSNWTAPGVAHLRRKVLAS